METLIVLFVFPLSLYSLDLMIQDRTFTDGSEHKSEVTYPSRREFLRCGRPSALPRPKSTIREQLHNLSADLQLCWQLNSGSDCDLIVLRLFIDAVRVKWDLEMRVAKVLLE